MKMIVRIVITSACISGLLACGGKGKEKDAGQQKEAIPAEVAAMQAAVQKNRDSTGLRLRLVDMLDSIGQYKQAASEMDSLLLKDSLNYGLWYTKGQVLEHGQDTTNAVNAYMKAIRVYPAPDALLSLANLYAERKDNRSLAILNNVRDMRLGRETDAHCAFIAGIYFARTQKRKEALQQFDNCIANNYTYMEAYLEKGLVYFDNQQYQEALQVFRFASSVNTLYADAYYYQARAYEMLGKKDSAVMKFQQSLSLDKNLQEARTALKRLGAE
jgi:tetratricopeptide (TPR) repeat protein